MIKTKAPQPGRLNSLGLSQREVESLLDELDSSAHSESSAGRKWVRRRYRQLTLPLKVSQQGGTISTFPVVSRNISRVGMAVLHSGYIHIGSKCSLSLTTPGGEQVALSGVAVRCQHRTKMVHEVGIVFDKPVDTRVLMDKDIFADWYSLESLEADDLKGSLLCIEVMAADRRLVRHYLRDTALSLTFAETAEAGIARATDAIELILCSFDTLAPSGAPLPEELRARGVRTPMIVTTADTSDENRARLEKLDAQAFLGKPMTESLVLRAIGEFLLLRATGARPDHLGSVALDEHDPGCKLAAEFLADLLATGDAIERGLRAGDVGGCRRACLGLRGSAPSFGFQMIADQADRTLSLLGQGKDTNNAALELVRLIHLCRRPPLGRVA
ncbi:MAG: PilZ domain-containing protein [Phycisphaerales bacterium]|nr:PilZ domain-containing protein [Phycisphaerales bacterium]